MFNHKIENYMFNITRANVTENQNVPRWLQHLGTYAGPQNQTDLNDPRFEYHTFYRNEFNISDINETMLSLYIVPYDGRTPQE